MLAQKRSDQLSTVLQMVFWPLTIDSNGSTMRAWKAGVNRRGQLYCVWVTGRSRMVCPEFPWLMRGAGNFPPLAVLPTLSLILRGSYQRNNYLEIMPGFGK